MADYTTIIAAIDTAIENWAGTPMTLAESGRSVTYRSLRELLDARRYYASLSVSDRNSKGFTIHHLKAGGAR